VLPGVTVPATNVQTNDAPTTTANEVGLFRFAALPPGRYTVRTKLTRTGTLARSMIWRRNAEINLE